MLILVLYFWLFAAASSKTAYTFLSDDGSLYISNEYQDSWIVKATFEDKISLEGFAYLTSETNPNNPDVTDETKAYTAGLIEGDISRHYINQSFYNAELREWEPCENVKNFIVSNYEFIKKMVDANYDINSYWYQVGLVLYQIKGLEDGFLNKSAEVSRDIDPLNLFWLYYWQQADIDEVQQKFGVADTVLGSGSCSALIKNLGNDLITTHVTWYKFSSMLRVVKKATLSFSKSRYSHEKIASETILESSYPGLIHSVDDYYVTSQNMVVQETTNEVYNSSLFANVVSETVPYFIRVNVANRMSSSGQEWTDLFSKYNSGTYCNQWMVVDYKQFAPNQEIQDGTLWVLEQMPGFIVSKDMSSTLRSGQNAWTSYNAPYFQKTQQMDNITAVIKEYGPFFSHDDCPRAKIFQRDLHKAVDINTTMALMRYNDFRNDPYAKCNCTPLGYSGENGISARGDLNPLNGTYKIAAEGARCHGATDLKIANAEMVKNMQMMAISGPTFDQQPVFDWSSQENTACEGRRHEGHPLRFQFEPVLVAL